MSYVWRFDLTWVVQWTAFIATVWGGYLMSSLDGNSPSADVLMGFGVPMFTLAFVAYVFAKRLLIGSSIAALCVSLVVEGGMYATLILLGGNWVYSTLSAEIVGGWHFLSVTIALVFYSIVHSAQQRLVDKINRQVVAMRRARELAATNPLAYAGAQRMQAALRSHRDRKLAIRNRELLAWSAQSVERRVVTVVVYGALMIVIGFCTYINLLFGVKFSPSQSRAWVLASITSFATDALVNQPVALFVIVVVTFALRVLRSSMDAVLVSKIVEHEVQMGLITEEEADVVGVTTKDGKRAVRHLAAAFSYNL